MTWDPTAYALLSLAAGAISAVIVIAGWRYRSEPAAPAFLALVAALAGWSVVYGIQLGFPTVDAQLGWQRIALPIGGTIPTLWFLFAAAEPVAFWLLTLTNPAHGLVWRAATIAPDGQTVVLSLGPGYFLHITYAYLLIAAGLWMKNPLAPDGRSRPYASALPALMIVRSRDHRFPLGSPRSLPSLRGSLAQNRG